MLARELEQQADDLILQPAQPLGAAPAVAILEQQQFGLGAPFVERGLQPLRQRGAQFALAAVGLGELFQVGGDGAAIDQLARCRAEGSGTARLSRDREQGSGGVGIAEAEP